MTLLQQLEAAGEGSSELDAAIAALDGWCLHPRTTYECVQSDSGRTCDDCGANSWGSRSKNAHAQRLSDPCPAYTASLDAALALAERTLPNVQFVISTGAGDQPPWVQGYPFPFDEDNYLDPAMASTPALALCAAILRAKQ